MPRKEVNVTSKSNSAKKTPNKMVGDSDTYKCTLPEAACQYAVENLREDISRRDADIQYIRDWIKTQPKLHAREDSVMILRFLRGCKFDYEKTKRKITNFYMLRAKASEWFNDRDPLRPELKELMELGVFLPLRKRDENGRLVVLIRAAAHNPSRHLQANVFKVGKMILDLALEEDESISVYGVAAVFDLQGVTLGHALQLPPHVIKKAVHAWQDCYPVRTKHLDFVNAPVYVNVILNIFRQFMTEKLRHRTRVHSRKLSSLHSVVSPELLPAEYGGTDGTLRELTEYWLKKTTERRQWFLDDSKYKAEL